MKKVKELIDKHCREHKIANILGIGKIVKIVGRNILRKFLG